MADNNSFEQQLALLEQINRTLESGEAGLEESIALYEKGMELVKSLEKKLADFEGRIEKVTNDPELNSGEGLETETIPF